MLKEFDASVAFAIETVRLRESDARTRTHSKSFREKRNDPVESISHEVLWSAMSIRIAFSSFPATKTRLSAVLLLAWMEVPYSYGVYDRPKASRNSPLARSKTRFCF
jgi:hypothetical protein